LSQREEVTRSDTPAASPEPTPHPLALELAAALASLAVPRALLLGVGNGRNVPPLLAAGAHVDAIEDDPARASTALTRFAADARVRIVRASYAGPYPFTGPYDAALSTHALLHGSPQSVAAALAAVRFRLAPNAPFFFTLGSKRDPRFGRGRRLQDDTYAPESGSEAGVPHCYFDAPAARALLEGFVLDRIEENVAPGSWAHAPDEAAAIIHWFVRARRD
jgi:hypothetical protein